MKRTFFAVAVALCTTTLLAQTSDFAGKWTLSKNDSKNLPKSYDVVSDATIGVKQDAKAFAINVTIKAEGRPDYNEEFLYPLDGTTRDIETTVRTPTGPLKVPTSLAATTKEGGSLELSETRTVTFAGRVDKFSSVELWSVSKDGKTLTVHRKDQRPQGASEYQMVFHRK